MSGTPGKTVTKIFVEESAAVDYLTASGLVVRGPLRLHSIILTASGGNASLGVYDNVDNSGNEKFTIETTSNQSTQFKFDGVVRFGRGLFLDFSANVASVTVIYWVDF